MNERVKKIVHNELKKDDERTCVEICKTLNETGHNLQFYVVGGC